MKIFKKFNDWWKEKRFLPRVEKTLNKRHHKYSLISKFFIIIGQFWIKHWQFIIGITGTIIALGVLIIMILEYLLKIKKP